MIRLLQREELGRVHELGRAFFAAANRPGTYNEDAFERLWGALLEGNLGALVVSENNGRLEGIFGGIVCEDPYSGDLIATEQFWYCFPEARGSVGLRLFKAFETVAVNRGAKRIMMIHLSHLTPESLRKLYTRRGYHEVETIYEKNLWQ